MALDGQLGDDSWQMVCTACCNLAPVSASMHLFNDVFNCFCPFLLLFVAVVVFFFNVIDKLDGMVDDTSMT